MTKEEIINTISQNYQKLSASCISEFFLFSKLLKLDKSTRIVSKGQYSDKAYYIAKGGVRSFYIKDGKDVSNWFAFENEFICSFDGFYLNKPSQHFIEVTEPSIILELPREGVKLLSERYREFDRLEKLIVVKTMIQLQERIVSLQFETAYQKYDNLLKIRPGITQRVPLIHIASYLGITSVTLSRIRNPKLLV